MSVRKIAKRILGIPESEPEPPSPYQRMPSFEDAKEAAGDGYLDPAVLISTGANDVREPSLIGMPDFFGPFFTMLSRAALETPNRQLRVLDFGGATGDYFDFARAMFGETIQLDWHVVETEMYVRNAREAKLRGSFHTSTEDAPDPDIAMFSGVLQYIRDWKDPLSHPKILKAQTIYIARTPIGDEYSPFLQRTEYPGAVLKYAGAILPMAEISEALSPTHYLYASWTLWNYLGELGTVQAPAMIWRLKSDMTR